MSNFQVILLSILLLILILLSAFFSCAETALMAVNRYRLRHKARMKNRSAISLLHLLKRPDRVLGVILIGNTFANILASSLATLIALRFWGEKGAFLVAIMLTFIILIFSEIAPKTLAAFYPDRIARIVVYPIQWFLRVAYPIVWLANTITSGLFSLLRIRVDPNAAEPISREELRSVVYDTAGKISRQYQNMLLTILDLNKLTVDDAMIPRHEIVGIDVMQPWEEIVKQLNQFRQDWLPFYNENVNQIVGVLYTPDILRILVTKQILTKELLLQFLQEPYFVPEGTSLNIQLAYFQRTPHRVAFVVDEYGEIQGLLTLNDILEEIVGDFTKSVDAMAKRIQLQPDKSYLVDGAVTVREFNRITEWELPLRGPRTINGLITEYLESLPHVGVAILIADYPIEIIEVKDNRVRLARIFPQIKSSEKNHAT